MAQQEEMPPPPSPRLPAPVPWGPADVALALGLAVFAFVVIMVPLAVVAAVIAGPDADLMKDERALAILIAGNLLLELVLLALVVAIVVGKYRRSLADLGLRLPRRGGLWLPFLVVLGALVIIGLYIGILRATGFGDPESNIPKSAFDSALVIPIVAVLSLLFAPLIEEIFFRGFLFAGLRQRWGFLGAALSSAFLFALAHVNPVVYVPITGIGFLFAGAYAYSGSLFASIVAHFLFNGVSFLVAVTGGGS